MEPINVLYIDDCPLDRKLVHDALEKEDGGFHITEVGSRVAFETRLAECIYDLVLSDFNIPDFDGLQVIDAVSAAAPPLPVVILTGSGSEDVAVEAMKRGAADYIVKKPHNIQRLPLTLRSVLNRVLTEDILKEQYPTLRSIIDSVDALIFSVDQQYNYTSFNQAHAAEMKAIFSAEIEIGHNLLDYITMTEVREAIRVNFDRALIGEKIVEEVFSGEELKSRRYFLISYNPIRNKTGQIIGVAVLAQDITENKQVEAALRDSEKRLRLAMEATKIGVFDWNVEHDTCYASPEYYSMPGYEPKNLPENRDEWLARVHADDRPHVEAKIQKILDMNSTGETPIAYEYQARFRHANGAYRWEHIKGFGIEYDQKGRVIRILEIRMDITEQKKLLDELQESQAMLYEAQQIAHIGNWWHDLVTNEIFWSDEFFRILGREPQKPTLELAPVIIHPDDLPMLFKAMEESSAGKLEHDHEYRVVRPDGEIRWVHNRWKRISDENGNEIKRIGTHQDITERKRIEEELALHREYLEELVNERTAELEIAKDRAQQYLDVASVLLIALNVDHKITLINQKGCAILEYSQEEIIGSDWYKMFVPENIRSEALLEFQQIMAGEIDYYEYFEKPVITKTGKKRLIAWHNTLIRDNLGKIVGLLSSGEDITVRKQTEVQIKNLNQDLLERTTALEAANKELEAFAYSVSHDLRAPLRHINGFIKLLQENIAEVLNEKNQHYMNNILDASKQMGNLIDDLLSFSRLGRKALSKTRVDLHALVQEIVREFKAEITSRTINWHFHDLPIVSADHMLIRSVLINMISNAIKFTRPRAVGEIEIGYFLHQTEPIIFIRDNGVGFDMNYTDKLFRVFQRLHHASEFEGTGIGLANVQRIINRHGGRVWAEGEINQGATFYFSLPQVSQETVT